MQEAMKKVLFYSVLATILFAGVVGAMDKAIKPYILGEAGRHFANFNKIFAQKNWKNSSKLVNSVKKGKIKKVKKRANLGSYRIKDEDFKEEKLSPNCTQEETKTSKLLDLIYDENVGEALKLLESCGPEDLTNQDASPLIEAAARGLIDLFKPLVNKGASISERVGEDKWTALHCAISHAPEELRVDVVKELLELGSDCNIPDADGDTAFMGACDPEYYSPELINVFFDQSVKIKPNLKNVDDSKVKPDIKNGVDWSVVSTLLAEEKPIIGVVKFLLDKGIEPDEAFRKFTLPLCAYNTRKADKLLNLIYKENIVEALKLLESCGPKDLTNQDPSPLGEAAERGRIDLFKPLINKGANINEQVGEYKWTALHCAVAFAPKELKVDVIKALLELGADPNIPDDDGDTAFMTACDPEYYSSELINVFFDQSVKIKPNLKNVDNSKVKPDIKNGVDWLDWSVVSTLLAEEKPIIGVVKLLLDKGIEPDEAFRKFKIPVCVGKTPGTTNHPTTKYEPNPSMLLTLIKEKKVADAPKLLESCDPGDLTNQYASPLAEAASKGLIDRFKPLINKGANINEQVGSSKWTALHYAVTFAPEELKVDTVKALLELGGDPNIPDDDGNTAFLKACGFYYAPGLISTFFDKSAKIKPDLSKKNEFGWSALFCISRHASPASETVELLLKNGSDPNEVQKPSYLSRAAERGLFALFKPLINYGADINERVDDNKRTALHYAVAFAPEELVVDVVKALLELGADPNIPCDAGNTAFLKACHFYYTPELISAFFDKSAKIKPDLSKKNKFGHTALFLILRHASPASETVELLLKNGSDPNEVQNPSYLAEAAKRGLLSLFKPLINYGANINEQVDDNKRTALHYAVIFAPEELVVDVVKALLELGADPNIPCDAGNTAFLKACHFYYTPELISAFFDKSAKIKPDLSKKNKFGHTALFRILQHASPTIETVGLLLKNGSDPNEVIGGLKPLEWIEKIKKKEKKEKIKRKEIDPYLKIMALIKEKRTADALKLLESCDPEDIANHNPSPLAEAAIKGLIDLFKPLINRGANINEQVGSSKRTALHYAVAFAPKKLKVDVVKALLELGGDPNIPCDDGNTAFLKACHFYYTSELISAFFDKSAKIKPDLLKKNESGDTALCLILQDASPAIETVEVLLKNGSDPNEVIEGLKPHEWLKQYGSPSIATNKIIECLASASLKLLSAVQKPDSKSKKIKLEEKGKPDLSTLSKLEVKMKNWSLDDSLKFEQN